MKRKLTAIVLLGLMFSCLNSFAQEINITNIQLKGKEVEISYNIIDERIDRTYQIDLYNSIDNFIQPMEKVRGEVGVDIKVGENKKMVWDVADELGSSYKGALSLEVKGNYYVPFISIEGISEGREFKRKVSYDFNWAGGRGDNILNFELYKGDNLVTSFDERPNTGNTTIKIPSRVKPGNNYRFKISDANNRDEVVYTKPFKVKRKFPLIVKVGSALIIGAGLYILADNLIPEKEFEVPDAPLPTRQ